LPTALPTASPTASPAPTEANDGGSTTVVRSALTLTGLTVEQAKAIEPAIVAGIAKSVGVSEDAVEVTGYAASAAGRRLLLGRRLQAGVRADFQVAVAEGQDPTAVQQGVADAADSPSEMLADIKEAVEADDGVKDALAALGGSMDDVALEVEAPTVVQVASPTPAPTTSEAKDESPKAGEVRVQIPEEEAKGGVPFIPLLIVFILFIFAAGGSYYYKKQQEMKDQKLTEAAQEETMGESNEEATRA